MRKKKVVTRKHYSAEFKLNAVKMTFEPGRTVEDVAQELGVSVPSLSKWRTDFRSQEDLKSADEALQAKTENDRLKAELKRLKLENEILKQAAVYFASQK